MMHPPAGRRSESRPPPRNGDPTTRLEAGDARTLAALYDRHAGAMYSLAMRITGEPDAAVAIVRAVFAAAWSEAARHPGRHAPDVHWLLSTTRVRAIDDVRARGAAGEAAPSGVETAGDEASAGTQARDVATLYPPDPAQGQVADEDDSEDTPRLRATFRGLPVLERLAIELAYFEGLTITQIAARLEQPPRTVNLRIRNGLQRFAGRPDTLPASEPQNGMPPTGDLAGLYALGALNASERAAFDAHLEVHRESVDEVLSLLPVTRRLALTAPPHELPSGLRDRVIETVTGARLPRAAEGEAPESSPSADTDAQPDPAAQDGQESVNEGDGTELASAGGRSELGAEAGSPEPVDVNVDAEPADEGDSAEPAEPGGVPGASDADENAEVVGGEPDPTVDQATEPVPTPPPQEPTSPMQQPTPAMQEAAANERQPTPTTQKRGGRWAVLLAAGSLVVAVGLGLVAARRTNLATALQENLDAANTQARIAELETAAARRTADELRAGARVLTAADVQMIDLEGQPPAPDSRGRLFWSASAGGLFTATGLPPVPPGRVYQLWLIPEATPLRAALLSADPEGHAMAAVTLPEGVAEPVPAAITLEPADGAESPSGDVYLLGRP